MVDIDFRQISFWETGERLPAVRDRKRILQIIKILHDQHTADGLSSLFDANSLLNSAGLRHLTLEEILLINPNWSSRIVGVTSTSRSENFFSPHSRFMGREQESAKILNRLRSSNCRLLSLIGIGGIGKTQLALHIASQFTPNDFPDGINFVDLSRITSASLLSSSLTQSLHLDLAGYNDLDDHLIEHLSGKQLLLILDNYEHLLPDTRLLSKILESTAKVKLLITSRERLNLRTEWLFDLKGLSYPIDIRANEIQEYESVKLFCHIGAQIQQDFSLNPDNYTYIANICKKLEGMPLAIELAAAQTRINSCFEISTALEHGIKILQSSVRDTEQRHQNIYASLQPTWERLSYDEQVVAYTCSIFQGSFTLGAITTIAQVEPQVLTSLIDRCLIFRWSDSRFKMHEIVRQFSTRESIC